MSIVLPKPRVLLTRPLPPNALRRIRNDDRISLVFNDSASPPTPTELKNLIKGCSGAIVLLTEKVDASVLLAAGPQLKVISTVSVGYDHIDIEAVKQLRPELHIGITPDVLTDATAELTIGLLLATMRRFKEATTVVNSGDWGSWNTTFLTGKQVSGKCIGFVGFGRIGQAVCRRLKSFNPELVLYYSPSLKLSAETELQAKRVQNLQEFLGSVDIVIVTCKLVEETRRMFNAETFRYMRPGCVFINTSRGGVVDHDSLFAALSGGVIAAAGLDVTGSTSAIPSLQSMQGTTLPNSGGFSDSASNASDNSARSPPTTPIANKPNILRTSDTTHAQQTLRLLFGSFVEIAETLLHDLVFSRGEDTTTDLSVALRPGSNSDFDGILRGLAAAARACQKDLIESLMAWRSEKSRTAEHWFPHVDSIYSSPNMEMIVYNRQMMVANFVLLRAWIEIVGTLDANTLQEPLAAKMEYVAFNQLRYENPELVATNPTCKAHIDLNAEFLGKLSNLRFTKVTDSFIKEISELSKPTSNMDPNIQSLRLEIIIRAMRYVKLKIYPMDALEESAEFLMILAGFFSNSHNLRIKHAYCDLLVELLEPVVAVATAEANLPTWKEAIELIFGKAMRMLPKKGHIQHSLPLVTTTLCLSRREFLVQNLASVIDVCIQRLRDKQMKSQALLSLTRILWVNAHRSNDSASVGTQKRVETLLKHIFPLKTPLINPPDVNLDMLTRLVYISMVKYMESLMELFSILMLGIDGTMVTSSNAAGSNGSIGSDKSPMNSRRSDSSHQSISEQKFGGAITLEPESFASANSVVGPKRQMIGLRSFLVFLADIEDSIESSFSTQYSSPWAEGYGGNKSGTIGSTNTAARSVVVQSKLKLLPPPFPSLVLSDKGDLASLAEVRKHYPSVANAKGQTTAWVFSDFSKVEISNNEDYLSLPLSNQSMLRFSSSVRIYMERCNDVLGSMLLALDKVCGNHLVASNSEKAINASTLTSAETNQRHLQSDSNVNLVDGSAASVSGMTKWAQYELLRNCIDLLPRFCPAGISANRVVELLTSYTCHVDESVRKSSVQALLRISKTVQGVSDNNVSGSPYWCLKGQRFHPKRSLAEATAKVVADAAVSLFMDKGIDAYSIVSSNDNAIMQNAAWVILTLVERVFSELKQLEVSDIELAELNNAMHDAEHYGLLFLCSPTVSVRKIGKSLLGIANSYEEIIKSQYNIAMKPQSLMYETNSQESEFPLMIQNTRVLTVLEVISEKVLLNCSSKLEKLDIEGSEYQRLWVILGLKTTLLDLALSTNDDDCYLWDLCIQDVLHYLLKYGDPLTVFSTTNVVISQLQSLHSSILVHDGQLQSFPFGINVPQPEFLYENPKHQHQINFSGAESIFPKWRLSLKIACSWVEILTLPNMPSPRLKPQHLFQMIVAYFFADSVAVRKSAIAALSCLDKRSYQSFYEILLKFMTGLPIFQKQSNSSAQGSTQKMERFQIELTHVFAITTDFMGDSAFIKSGKENSMFKLVLQYIGDVHQFLSDPETQTAWEYSTLRCGFCVLVQHFYMRLVSTVSNMYSDSGIFNGPMDELKVCNYFPFDLRWKIFHLMETWCGYGKQATLFGELQAKSMIKALDMLVSRDSRNPSKFAEAMNKQRSSLQLVASSAMVALLHGPMKIKGSPLEFSLPDTQFWISDLLNAGRDEFLVLGSLAVQGMLIYNSTSTELLDSTCQECYNNSSEHVNANGHFNAIATIYAGSVYPVLADQNIISGVHWDYPCNTVKLLALGMFKAGDLDLSNRKNALRLLHALHLRKAPHLQLEKLNKILGLGILDSEITNISAANSHIYNQLCLSKCLSLYWKALSIQIVSELFFQLEQLTSRRSVQNILNVIAPWIKNLQIVPAKNGENNATTGKTFQIVAGAETECLLKNMCYITICFGDEFPHEINNVWKSLVCKESDLFSTKNINHFKHIIDFLLGLGTSSSAAAFITYAKKIVASLAAIFGSHFVVDYLLQLATPVAFSSAKLPKMKGHGKMSTIHCMNLDMLLPVALNQQSLSIGSLIATFCVDLVVQVKANSLREIMPCLIHIALLQFEHPLNIVREQMKILLLHILESLQPKNQKALSEFIAKLSHTEDRKQVLNLENITTGHDNDAFSVLKWFVSDLVEIIQSVYAKFEDDWMLIAVQFAVGCNEYNAACKSLQILQCLTPKLESEIFSKLLLKLSVIIADVSSELQLYSAEILQTIFVLIESDSECVFDKLVPRIFWFINAVLTSPLELEYMKGIQIFELFLMKVNLDDSEVMSHILDLKPVSWLQKENSGMFPLLLCGLMSSKCERICLSLVNKLALMKNTKKLVGIPPEQLALCLIANFPRLALFFDANPEQTDQMHEIENVAASLAKVAEEDNLPSLARLLHSYAKH
ncbi:Cell morphogenesis protein PAG1, partial [Entophlyctis luteolus]